MKTIYEITVTQQEIKDEITHFINNVGKSYSFNAHAWMTQILIDTYEEIFNTKFKKE